MANGNRVNFVTRERVVTDDFNRIQTAIGRNMMDLLLCRHQSYQGDGDEQPAVLGGFNVETISGRTLTIGEGMGFTIDTTYYDGTETNDGESRARLLQIQPDRDGVANSKTITLPANTTGQPRFVLIYAEPAEAIDMQEYRDFYDPSSSNFSSVLTNKWLRADCALSYEVGSEQATPNLPSAWNPLVGPVDVDKLLLYAVYCPNGYTTIERGDILDLRYMYNPGSNTIISRLAANPLLQTSYDNSPGESDAVIYQQVEARLRSQPSYIAEPLTTEVAAWTSSRCYCPDDDVRTESNRQNRPIYWYVLPPVGIPQPYYSSPLARRPGMVSCCDLPPDEAQNELSRTWTLYCGNSYDHKYTMYTYGLFMGSLLVGENSDGDQMIYGQKRCGDRVWITEKGLNSTLGAPLPSDCNYGKLVAIRIDDWTNGGTVDIEIHQTPTSSDACLLPVTAREIEMEFGMSIENRSPNAAAIIGDELELLLFLGDDYSPAYLDYPTWQVIGLRQYLNDESLAKPVKGRRQVTMPFPWYDQSSAHRYVRVLMYGEKEQFAQTLWWAAILGYSEPVLDLDKQSYPTW